MQRSNSTAKTSYTRMLKRINVMPVHKLASGQFLNLSPFHNSSQIPKNRIYFVRQENQVYFLTLLCPPKYHRFVCVGIFVYDWRPKKKGVVSHPYNWPVVWQIPVQTSTYNVTGTINLIIPSNLVSFGAWPFARKLLVSTYKPGHCCARLPSVRRQ